MEDNINFVHGALLVLVFCCYRGIADLVFRLLQFVVDNLPKFAVAAQNVEQIVEAVEAIEKSPAPTAPGVDKEKPE